jgi:YD repeat-containing protein
LSWNYDCVGRATSNQLAGGLRQTTLTYGTPDSTGAYTTTLIDTLGNPASPQTNTHHFGFNVINNVSKIVSIDQPCSECRSIATYGYDANGNVISATDFNGNVTTFQYDTARNLETSRTEASGTSKARTITTQWHATYRLPTQITEPGRTTTFNYDTNGNLLSKTISAGGSNRTWSYAYNANGQILTATGPRTDVTDVTNYAYDSYGNLASITNAVGQITTLSNYDANGRVGLITDPNGATTAFTYAPRGWLTNKVVTAGAIVQSTTYSYDNAGQLTQVTLPDNSTVSYTYDAAHRLIKTQDSLGNSINYTLDLWGNRMSEAVTDPNGVLTRQVSRIFDAVNRLQQVTGAAQ